MKTANMKLHVTFTSPYARTARAAIIEHALEDVVEVVEARTRQADSPYYAIAPSGRVPFLERDEGPALEETDIIVGYFDEIGSGPPLARPMNTNNWGYGHLHALVRTYIDGVGVWGREVRRPLNEQSPSIIAHEQARNRRLVDAWERTIDDPMMNGDINLAQITLFAAFDALIHYTGVEATPHHPRLQAWRARLSERPSLSATRPPARK